MSWARKFLAYLLSLALVIVLLFGVTSFSFNSHFSKPDNLKNWLGQSQIYDHFVSDVISQSQISLGSNGQSSSISLSDATVQQAAQSAFSPQLLQSSANNVLDATYAWLQGKTSKPQFTIDLTQAKQGFASQVGQYAQDRFNSLPVCSAAQLAQLQNIDPLTIPCRPAGISPAAEGAQITQQLASTNRFLPNPVLTADNIQSNATQPYYQKLSFAPTVYHWSSFAPIILGALAVLLALAIVFIQPRRQGLRKLAGALLLTGLLLVATKYVSDYVFNKLQKKLFANTGVGPLQQSITDVIHRAENALTATDFYCGIALIAVALVVLIILLISHHRRPAVPSSKRARPTTETPPMDSAPIASPTDSPQTKPTSAPPLSKSGSKSKRNRLIQ